MASGEKDFLERRSLTFWLQISKYLEGSARNPGRATNPMATFYKFGQLWEIPPAAARLGKSLPANTQAFDTFLTNLEPMYSAFICAHPRCPKDPDLPAIRYAIKEFMEEQAPSNFAKERWAASYDPARKVSYCSWFLSTIVYFLDKVDFTALVPPPVEPMTLVFIAGQRRAPIDPRPQSAQTSGTSSPTSAAKPVRQSRLWHGGPTPQAFIEERRNEVRHAQLRHFQREASSALARLIGNADDGDQSD
jgi:hypothetical protein